MTGHPHRRLLDLLEGWRGWVAKCAMSEEPHPGVTAAEYGAEADAIRELYYQAGGMLAHRDSVPDAEVYEFIIMKVLPLVANGAVPRQGDGDVK